MEGAWTRRRSQGGSRGRRARGHDPLLSPASAAVFPTSPPWPWALRRAVPAAHGTETRGRDVARVRGHGRRRPSHGARVPPGVREVPTGDDVHPRRARRRPAGLRRPGVRGGPGAARGRNRTRAAAGGGGRPAPRMPTPAPAPPLDPPWSFPCPSSL